MDTTGAKLIAEERARQIAEEGWSPEHDDNHTGGELAAAAAYYCFPGLEARGLFPKSWNRHWAKRENFFHPTIRDLARAGALIAAEIDRRIRAGGD